MITGAKVDPTAKLETVNALYIPTNVKSIDSLLQRIRSRSGSNVIITPNPSYTVDPNSLQSGKESEYQYEYIYNLMIVYVYVKLLGPLPQEVCVIKSLILPTLFTLILTHPIHHYRVIKMLN